MVKRAPKASDSILERRDPEKSDREFHDTLDLLLYPLDGSDNLDLPRQRALDRMSLRDRTAAVAGLLAIILLMALFFTVFPEVVFGHGIVVFSLILLFCVATPLIIMALLLRRHRVRALRIGWDDSQKR